jgi:mRNA degradation ribonuclease J1/J2
LVRLGADVVHSGISDVHASGHAKVEELKTFLSIARPDWFVPVHGEYRHLAAHARIARRMGVSDDHVLICEDGDRVVLDEDGQAAVVSVLANAVARASICVQRRGCAPPLRDEVRAQVAAGSVQFALDANPA